MNGAGDAGVRIRIGGVPEHFNYPWTLAKERGIFAKHGANVEFVIKKCGTGAMIEAVKNGEIDACVALTEGLVADASKGSDVRILGTYVASPLCWAVSVGANAAYSTIDDLRGKTFGISRYGSGSHLMALVLAQRRGWDREFWPKFKVIGNFTNLRASVNSGDTDAFMWETFTTKPFHDSGEVKRVGDITTPWPCFMVAALKSTVDLKLAGIRAALAAVHEAAQAFHAESDTMPAFIAKSYGLLPEDAASWYKGVDISAHRYVSAAAIETALGALIEADVLKDDTTTIPADVIDDRVAKLQKDIRSCVPLYRGSNALIQLLHAELSDTSPRIEIENLIKYDQQHHYGGLEAIDEAIAACDIKRESFVINVGSGLGGCARALAWKTGCRVLAVELQHDLHSTAAEMTSRTNMSSQVTHMGGDFMALAGFLQPSSATAIVSWLTVLHISDRRALFKRAYDLLRPGGYFYAADFYAKRDITVSERMVLQQQVYCEGLPSQETYTSELKSSGFEIVTFDDRTAEWAQYTQTRSDAWHESAEKARVSALFPGGNDAWGQLSGFYDLIAQLFKTGNVGGAVIVGRKPLGW